MDEVTTGRPAVVDSRTQKLRRQLARAQGEWSAAVDALADIVLLLDKDGIVLRANQAVARWALMSAAEAVGWPLHHVLHPHQPDSVLVDFWVQARPQLEAGTAVTWSLDDPVLNRSLTLLARPIESDAGGEADAAFAVLLVRNDTERKQAEVAIHRARLVMENSPLVLCRWRATEGWPVEYVSDQIAQFGYTAAELMSGDTPYAALLHPDDLERVAREVAFHADQGSDDFMVECRIVSPDQQVFWTEYRVTVERNPQGDATHFQGIILDVTERREAQQTIREYLEKQQVLHEVGLALAQLDGLEALYRQAVVLGRSRLGFDRLALHLLDADGKRLVGTFGIAPDGEPRPEHEARFTIVDEEVLQAFVRHRQRVRLQPQAELWDEGEVVAQGWRIGAAMWADETLLGVLFADNLIQGEPLQPYQSELLAAYAGTVGNLIARQRAAAVSARRAAQLQTVARVGTAAATILETDRLLQEVVDLTQINFDLYHAHIYLLDAAGNNLVLTAGAGQVGRQMVAEGRIIPRQQTRSLVARAARTRRGVIVNDVRRDTGFLPHPLLPHTRAEMAVPLIVADRLMGVLDVQADWPGAFTQEDLDIQTTLAAQIAIALENARSFEQAQQAVAELDTLTRQLTRSGWESFLDSGQQESGYVYDLAQPAPLQPLPGGKRAQPETEDEALLVEALAIYGENIGRLAVDAGSPEVGGAGPDPKAADELLAAVAEQLSARLENLRLTEQTQAALAETAAQARRLARLNELAAALNAAPDVAAVHALAADNARDILEGAHAFITRYHADAETVTVMAVAGTGAPEVGRSLALPDLPGLEAAVRGGEISRSAAADDSLTATLVAPLRAGERLLGFIHAGSVRPGGFSDSEANLARQIASLLASNLENRRLLSETESRAEELMTINQVAEALSQHMDRPQLLHTVYAQLQRALQADAFHVGLVQPETNRIDYPLLVEAGVVSRQDGVLLHPDSHTARLLQTGQPIRRHLTAAEVARLQAAQPPTLLGEDSEQVTASLLFVPLRAADRIIGVLSVQSYALNAYSEADLALLNSVAGYLAVALENVRLFQETQQRAEQLQRLYEAGAALNAAQTYDAVLAALRRHTILGADASLVSLAAFSAPWTVEEAPVWSETLARYSDHPGHTLPIEIRLADYPTLGHWLQPDAPVILDALDTLADVDENTRQLYREQLQGQSAIFVPLVVGGQWIGYISAVYQQPAVFPEPEVRRLTGLAGQAAIAVQGIRLLQEARQRARREQLLRQITERVRGSADVETIMRTAVQEIGRTLGRRTAIYLGDNDAGA